MRTKTTNGDRLTFPGRFRTYRPGDQVASSLGGTRWTIRDATYAHPASWPGELEFKLVEGGPWFRESDVAEHFPTKS